MKDDKLSRRTFIRNTSLVAAGAIVGSLAGKGCTFGKKDEAAIRKPLNYNPNMEYRRLGKTGLEVSVVCLGGHWKRINKVLDATGKSFDENRSEV
ncbi:MAG: hypothetical protein ACYS30_11630, partial [Planctomycetota bacterium]